ncbi:cytochrome b5-like heme/steroid binding domain-containing protein [Phakopsora pachyrhizi]|uniref:Cytochrome b5-like heme/steroid binding domain-containing protein n=1 Tax=Phakopsora pachyrhizi TaxID=170000 RepID=A0AAV0B8F9_PHAPC|nr:cytochrome b5-like heme/steroid binding domain-containing protein [Phakopsora pachyrhizi]
MIISSYLSGIFSQTQPSLTGSEQSKGGEEEPEDDRRVPEFPSNQSIQRISTSATVKATIPEISLDSPSEQIQRQDKSLLSSNTGLVKTPTTRSSRVRLLPGFSQLDWAKLKSSGENLRGDGVTGLRRITRSELKEHRSLKDGEVWSSFNGKVYNLTSYLDFHPGGRKELLRVGGKDGTELFMKTHAWISVESMMDACLIGFLVKD